jgi:hypothetical protein
VVVVVGCVVALAGNDVVAGAGAAGGLLDVCLRGSVATIVVGSFSTDVTVTAGAGTVVDGATVVTDVVVSDFAGVVVVEVAAGVRTSAAIVVSVVCAAV